MSEMQRIKRGWGVSLKKLFKKKSALKEPKGRTGKCKMCGRCCEDCMFLNKKTKRCRIYHFRSGFFCYKEFPQSKGDLKLWKVEKTCGYKFRK